MRRQKTLFLLIFVVVATVGFVSRVSAMGERVSAKKTIPAKFTPGIFKSTGRVMGNNPQNSTVTISTSTGSPLTLVIDNNSTISKRRKNIKMSGISYGDFVETTYEVKKGQNIAKSIIVQEKPAFSSPKKRR